MGILASLKLRQNRQKWAKPDPFAFSRPFFIGLIFQILVQIKEVTQTSDVFIGSFRKISIAYPNWPWKPHLYFPFQI